MLSGKTLFTVLLLSALAFFNASALQADVNAKIDSLKELKHSLKDSIELIDLYYNLAELYDDLEVDSCLHYAEQSLQLAKEANDTAGKAYANDLLGYVYDDLGDFAMALSHFENALHFYDVLNDSVGIASCYLNIGYVWSHQFDQAHSLVYFLKSLSLAKEIGDSSILSDLYTNIASYYEFIDNYEMSKYYYDKSLKLDIALNYNENIALNYASLAYVKAKLQQTDEARKDIQRAFIYIPQIRENYYLGLLYTTITDYYLELEIPDSVRNYLSKTEILFTKGEYKPLKSYYLTQIGILKYIEGSYKECITALDKSIAFSRSIKNHEQFSDIYLKQSEAYAKIGKFKKAHYALEKSIAYADSLKINDVARMLGEFERDLIATTEMQNRQLQSDLMNQKNENANLVIRSNLKIAKFTLILLAILIVVIGYYYFSVRKINNYLKEQNATIKANKVLLKQHIERIQKSENELSESNATKDKFFSIIAHDLKNPFNALIGFSDLLKNDPDIKDSDGYEQIIEGIHNSAIFGYKLLENLLEWAQCQTGKFEHLPETLDLSSILETNVTYYKEQAFTKEIKVDFKRNGACFVHADKNMLDTIFRNLITNAIKFSYRKSKISITVLKKDGMVETHIQDEGIGMSKEDLEKLFNIESNLNRPGTNGERGTGLGLLLCKEFVHKNGGEIWATGAPEAGCCFSFALPEYTD